MFSGIKTSLMFGIGAGGTLTGRRIFTYAGSARLISFEIRLTSKEISRTEPENINIHCPPINALISPLHRRSHLHKHTKRPLRNIHRLLTDVNSSLITVNL